MERLVDSKAFMVALRRTMTRHGPEQHGTANWYNRCDGLVWVARTRNATLPRYQRPTSNVQRLFGGGTFGAEANIALRPLSPLELTLRKQVW